ncbi:hypothetical protein [Deinococcus soli (ex Cha et al. 2016)]|uniref:Uncharacterized protein n=2 Tax=Deinococcus soli (ex Cha et al. 2016) TaxID=1309411 RepID=A0ACC6KKX1_9DEIO|nr:hypothetical protein [Deinococcus soli (ex Cha et al. 2016)]MDR6218711.1 hypothetical protein [Deinococcus soli (ex Cha et al. 2016)]MDR6328508.1 hypothetical protein [Deinococcus soli (ex Cha et al. 2016)]MDR6753119.1 hypothetical protein [Deinococcus soli (ex Cha et al. 2016)]
MTSRTAALTALDFTIRTFSAEIVHDESDPRGRWGEGRAEQRRGVLGPAASQLARDAHVALRALEQDPDVQTEADADAATQRLARTLETQYGTPDGHVRHALAALSFTGARVAWADVEACGPGVTVAFGDRCWASVTAAETRDLIGALRAGTAALVIAEHEHEVSATSLHCVVDAQAATLYVGRLVDYSQPTGVTCVLSPAEQAAFADRLEAALRGAA